MELLAAFSIKEHLEAEQVCQILECVTTEEAVSILIKNGKLQSVMGYAMERICYYLEKRGRGKIQIDCIMYANEVGELARSKGVESWLTLLEQEQAR